MNRKFTLVELLIIIAIIAILAGMLLPVLQQARKKVFQISCVNNMKGLGLGLQQYLVDFDSFFPPQYSWVTVFWPVSIRNYIGKPGDAVPKAATASNQDSLKDQVHNSTKSGIFLCPDYTSDPVVFDMRRTYVTTSVRLDNVTGGFAVDDSSSKEPDQREQRKPRKTVKILSSSVILAEKPTRNGAYGYPSEWTTPVYAGNNLISPEEKNSYCPWGRHTGRTGNYLLMNGSVLSWRSWPHPFARKFDDNWVAK